MRPLLGYFVISCENVVPFRISDVLSEVVHQADGGAREVAEEDVENLGGVDGNGAHVAVVGQVEGKVGRRGGQQHRRGRGRAGAPLQGTASMQRAHTAEAVLPQQLNKVRNWSFFRSQLHVEQAHIMTVLAETKVPYLPLQGPKVVEPGSGVEVSHNLSQLMGVGGDHRGGAQVAAGRTATEIWRDAESIGSII